MELSFLEFIAEVNSPREVVVLQRHLNKLFYPLGLQVHFKEHFIERILGRESKVTAEEIFKAFAKLKEKYKRKLLKAKKMPGSYKGIIKDFSQDLNIVFRVEGSDMPAITIMRKPPESFGTDREGGEVLKVQ